MKWLEGKPIKEKFKWAEWWNTFYDAFDSICPVEELKGENVSDWDERELEMLEVIKMWDKELKQK